MQISRVKLRPITTNDTAKMVIWRNNPLILKTVFNSRPINQTEHLAWFNSLINNPKRLEFIIEIVESGEAIGRIGFDNIDHFNQKAEYSISIGETTAWGKGYGSEASHLILEYGFNQLNLNKIYLKVFADNQPAVKLYEKMGFIVEGVLKKDVFKDGEFRDVLFMSIFREDYIKNINK